MIPEAGLSLERPTMSHVLDGAVRRLRDAGIATARLDAKVLLLHVLGVGRETLARDPHAPVAPDALARFEALIVRRAAREPVGRLTGKREFWSLSFALSAETLIPRPDSESIVETALAALPDRLAPYRILDLGTGSGCLLLALLSEMPHAWGLGVDCSWDTLATAARNARDLGLAGRAAFLCSNWSAAIYGKFDLIVSNPPYVPTASIGGLEPEVARHEPRRALDGGADGLDAYRRIAPALPGLLAEKGRAVIEFGAGQDAGMAEILKASGLVVEAVGLDLTGRARCARVAEPEARTEKSVGNRGPSG